LPLLIYGLITFGLGSLQVSYAIKGKLLPKEIYYLLGLNIWLLVIGLIDVKKKIIPLWITGPIIVAALTFRFFDPSIDSDANRLPGFGLLPFYSAAGICLGFAIFDGITHFGNWLAKFPASQQGLIPIWNAMPLMIISLFVPSYPAWIIPVAICIWRLFIEIAYAKSSRCRNLLNNLCEKSGLTYLLLAIVIFIAFYLSRQALIEVPRPGYFPYKSDFIVFSLCLSYILEEIFIPTLHFTGSLIQRIFPKFNSQSSQSANSSESNHRELVQNESTQNEADNPTVLGGGDALLAASIGAIFGAMIFLYCMQMAFILAFFSILLIRLIKFISANLKMNKKSDKENASAEIGSLVEVNEIPFAPFITFSVQLIMLTELFFLMQST
jgi:Flp pilus assembly protein protease CpaA